MTVRLSAPKTVSPKPKIVPANRICTSPNARATPFGERTLRRARPAKISPEDVVMYALQTAGNLRQVARFYGETSAAMDVALDVAARIVETRSHEKYDPAKASVDSWLAGAARNIFRKRREVAARRLKILAIVQVTKVAEFGHRTRDEGRLDEPGLWDLSRRVRDRVTPTEAEVMDLALRVGPDPDRIAHATGWDPSDVRDALRGVRAAAGFLGLGQTSRACFH